VFFDLVVTDNDRIDGNSTVSVTAHVDNWTTGSDNLVLLEDDVPALSVLLPTSVERTTACGAKLRACVCQAAFPPTSSFISSRVRRRNCKCPRPSK
jgi:hypothetical protein